MTGDRPIPKSWTGWRVEDVELPNGTRVRARLSPSPYYPMPQPLGWVEHDQHHAERERRHMPHRYIFSFTPWDDTGFCGMCRSHVLFDKPDGVLSYLHPEAGRACGCCPSPVAEVAR